MDDYSRSYAEIADPVWEEEFQEHPLKAENKRSAGKRL
jgi:hypothetical protein